MRFREVRENELSDQFDRGTAAVRGAKAGIRGNRLGLFVKLRPGFMHFNKDVDCPGCDRRDNFEFALDVGGVVEYYPSSRFVVRMALSSYLQH